MRQRILSGPDHADVIADAESVLRGGGLVAIPTETVYGLAADAANGTAVAKIFAAKGRPRFNPLIAHVASRAMAVRYGVLDSRAEALAEAFWPGPLTLVLPLAAGAPVHPLVTTGLPSIALRAPRGAAAELIAAFGGAFAAPSANPSGRLSPTRAAHVAEALEDKVDLILDGGPCAVGLESTIVALVDSTARLLRAGGLAAEEIEAVLGAPLLRAAEGDPVTAPGMLASHYAPRLPLRLAATSVEPDEALLAFGTATLPGASNAVMIRNLSASADLVEAAANLFAHLAELDRSAANGIAAMAIPERGLGEAINDRLARAARG